MKAYLSGRDPCGMKWYEGDMTILRYVFLDARSWADPEQNLKAIPRVRIAASLPFAAPFLCR